VNEPTDKPLPYRVEYSGWVREELRKLLARAEARGLLRKAGEAVAELDARLHVYPQFGEPLRDLHAPGGTLWSGTVPPLVAKYVIDEGRRLVFILRPIQTLPGSGF
jgi:hypothetical protein